jgi:hypothetical protein
VIQFSRHFSNSSGQRRQHLIEPIVRGNAIREVQKLRQPLPLQPSELSDRHEVIRTADHGTDRDHDNRQQRVSDLPATWVRQLREVFLQLPTSV